MAEQQHKIGVDDLHIILLCVDRLQEHIQDHIFDFQVPVCWENYETVDFFRIDVADQEVWENMVAA